MAITVEVGWVRGGTPNRHNKKWSEASRCTVSAVAHVHLAGPQQEHDDLELSLPRLSSCGTRGASPPPLTQEACRSGSSTALLSLRTSPHYTRKLPGGGGQSLGFVARDVFQRVPRCSPQEQPFLPPVLQQNPISLHRSHARRKVGQVATFKKASNHPWTGHPPHGEG